MSRETAKQRNGTKEAAKSNAKLKTAKPSELDERQPDHTQLNSWLYETKRDQLTMAEILEQRKREAAGCKGQ